MIFFRGKLFAGRARRARQTIHNHVSEIQSGVINNSASYVAGYSGAARVEPLSFISEFF